MTDPVPFTGPAGNGRLISIDSTGQARVERDGAAYLQHLYAGMRSACLGADPRNPTRAVIAIEGGVADAEGEIADAVLFTLSAAALDSFADLLRETATELRRANTFDARFVL